MIASPCINFCQLDDPLGLCRGCLRTLGEIACWGSADDSTRLIILQRIECRRATAARSGGTVAEERKPE